MVFLKNIKFILTQFTMFFCHFSWIILAFFGFIFHSINGTINLHNWPGTFQYGTQNLQYPRSEAEVIEIVKSAKRLRCLGQRHSTSKIADSNDTILVNIGLKNIWNPAADPLYIINPLDPTVWVQAGITYTDLAPFLHQSGYALPNLASLADISIAGASQTGAHGSGNTHGCLATQIRSMVLVLANGTLVTIPAGSPLLKAMAVGLGAFGVITSVELELVKTYDVTNYVFLGLPHHEFMANFDAIMSAGYSVQVFADFLIPGVWNSVWVIERTDSDSNIGNETFLAGTSAFRTTEQISPMIFLPSEYMTDQGVSQPWYFGMVDYKVGILAVNDYRNSISGIGSGGDEIQTEYYIAYENATKAIQAVSLLWTKIGAVSWYVLVRSVKNDDIWMSPFYGPEGGLHIALAITFKPYKELVDPVLALVEAALIPFCARPHWGKYFLMTPDKFLHCYTKVDQFRALAEIFDPTHKFRNEFLEKNVFVGNLTQNGGITLPNDVLSAIQQILGITLGTIGGVIGGIIGGLGR